MKVVLTPEALALLRVAEAARKLLERLNRDAQARDH